MKKLKAFKEYTPVDYILLLLFVVQLAMICYFNLFLLENHTGFDSSWSYLKSALIWRERSLNSPMWTDQTSLFLDSSVLPAAFLYGLTGNLFVSYGISNLVIVGLILTFICLILKKIAVGNTGILFALNMVVCPYMTNGFDIDNDLGYFNDTLAGPAFYSLRVLIVLAVIYELMYLKEKNRISLTGWMLLPFCVLAGLSSGIFIIVIVVIPYLVYEMILLFVKNDWKHLKRLEVIYPVLVVASVMAGKIFAKLVLGIEAIDNSRTWTPIASIWKNIGAVIQGFMKLLQVLPVWETDVEVLSLRGICSLFPLFIFMIILFAVGYVIFKISSDILECDGKLLLFPVILLCNILTFSLFNALYGSMIFEERYLICPFMVMVIITAYFIDRLDKKLIVSGCVVWGLLISIICNDAISDRNYISDTYDMREIDEIKKVVDGQDADLIYFWGDDVCIAGRIMRAVDLDRIYKVISNGLPYYHWGDYLYDEDNASYKGSTLLVVGRDSQYVPEHILDAYTHLVDLTTVSIYRSDENGVDRISGITGDESIDLPTAIGIKTQMGQFEGNSFVTDGTEGYVLYGPESPTTNGTYDFVIDYEVLGSEDDAAASCDVSIDNGNERLAEEIMEKGKTQVVLSDVKLQEGHSLEYRIWCYKGTIMKINKITIIKKGS